MKITHKLLLVFACLALLTFSCCAQTHDEPNAFPVEEITTTAEVLTKQLICFTFDANDTLGSSGYTRKETISEGVFRRKAAVEANQEPLSMPDLSAGRAFLYK